MPLCGQSIPPERVESRREEQGWSSVVPEIHETECDRVTNFARYCAIKFKGISVTYLFYACGWLLLIFSIVTTLAPEQKSSEISMGLMWSGTFLLGTGFIAHIWPWLQSYQRIIAAFMGIVSIIVNGVFAVSLSRDYVSYAIGLPPQDLDLTVATFSALATALLFPMFTILPVAIGYIVIGAFTCLFLSIIEATKLTRLRNAARRITWHAAGACFIPALAYVVYYESKGFIFDNPQWARWVAYYTDYHFAPNYPGVDTNKRLRLHENGVVSYAEEDEDGHIKITVSKVAAQ